MVSQWDRPPRMPRRRVLEGDHEVDARYREVESRCIDLFALQQPVAGDLRRIASTFEIATDLERVGDHAVNVSARTLYMTEGDDSLRE